MIYTVLHLVLGHLDKGAVILLLQHRVDAVARDPGVVLQLGQRDSLQGTFHQHLLQEICQLCGETLWNLQTEILTPALVPRPPWV